MRWWPRSLLGQLALLVAIALFVAQAINFALLLRERRSLRFAQVAGPAITRLVDAAEGVRSRELRSERGERRGGGPPRRVRLLAANPIAPGTLRAHDIEAAIADGMRDAGVPVAQVVTGIRRIDPDDPRLDRVGERRARRIARFGAELTIAVEQPGRGWWVLSAPWARAEPWLIGRLVAQTLILFVVLLLPVLWLGRRITRPLAALAGAARGFTPGGAVSELPEQGPEDVRQVTAAFNALTTRVTAMLNEKDRMLGAIGHDLRTPLAALRVRIESVDDEADRARMADTVDEMSRTLDDILSLARLGRPSEPVTKVDLAALVEAVVDDFRDLGAVVTFADTPRLTWRLRPTLMRRAVRNLIENAVKYAGGAEVSLVRDAAGVRIEVTDRGPGILAEGRELAFEAFTRGENSRNRETGGIGLGLALARAIVRDAGGEITLADRPGGGLLASIFIPA